MPAFQQQPANAFRTHVANQLSQLGTNQIFDAMELVSERSSHLESSGDPMKEARMQRKKNKLAAANMIGNKSMQGSEDDEY